MKLRLLKLFVLIGFPVFGFLYAYQFTGQDREVIGPFRPFVAPSNKIFPGGSRASQRDLPLVAPITVVNYWATWCPPCVEEFPAMIELRRQLADKGVKIVFVSVDEDWKNVEKFLAVNHVAYDSESMFWDPTKEGAQAWGSAKFPETYVVRKDKWVVEKIIGAQAWTRPVVIKYFVELGEKYQSLTTASLSERLMDFVIPQALAQDSAPEGEPAIHEQDQKNLEKLKSNIEVATQNLQNAEAAEKEEERNLQEEKIVLERRQKELSDAEDDLEKIESKNKEVAALQLKTNDSLKLEEREKAKVEKQIKDIQEKIADLQKRLDQSKDELNQANKGLNTRVQAIETFEKAKASSGEELDQLKTKREKAKGLVADRKKEKTSTQKEILDRQKKLLEIRAQKARAKKVLDDQKKKLNEFEQLLKK